MSDAAEIERAAGILEDQWTEGLGYDLDDLYAEDAAALDFAAKPNRPTSLPTQQTKEAHR